MFNPDDSYFKWFGLSPGFEVDTEALGESYRRLQADVHPDRFAAAGKSGKAGKTEEKQQQAVRLTGLLNQGYATLMSPVKRAAYLLKLQGEDPEKFDQAELPLDLLEEQMELRERLEDLPVGDVALDDLKDMKDQAQEKMEQKQTEFAGALDRGELSEARLLFHELQFLDKLLKEIVAAEERRFDY